MANKYIKTQVGDALVICKHVELTKETGINHGNEDNAPQAEVEINIPYVGIVGAQVHNGSIDTAVEITIPAGANGVLVSGATQHIRYTLDNQAPTASLGLRLIKDQNPFYISVAGVAHLKVISETSGGAIDYQFVA